MSAYLMRILEKIINHFNRIYQSDFRIVQYGKEVYIKDLSYDPILYGDCDDNSFTSDDGCFIMPVKTFGRDYSGSCVLGTFLTKIERSIAKTNFNLT